MKCQILFFSSKTKNINMSSADLAQRVVKVKPLIPLDMRSIQIDIFSYRIRSNYRIYPYKRTVKQFRILQIKASVFFVYFKKAYVVGTHLNCINLLMQFK